MFSTLKKFYKLEDIRELFDSHDTIKETQYFRSETQGFKFLTKENCYPLLQYKKKGDILMEAIWPSNLVVAIDDKLQLILNSIIINFDYVMDIDGHIIFFKNENSSVAMIF